MKFRRQVSITFTLGACKLRLFLARLAYLWAALALLADVVFTRLPARAAVTEAWIQHYSNLANNPVD